MHGGEGCCMGTETKITLVELDVKPALSLFLFNKQIDLFKQSRQIVSITTFNLEMYCNNFFFVFYFRK